MPSAESDSEARDAFALTCRTMLLTAAHLPLVPVVAILSAPLIAVIIGPRWPQPRQHQQHPYTAIVELAYETQHYGCDNILGGALRGRNGAESIHLGSISYSY